MSNLGITLTQTGATLLREGIAAAKAGDKPSARSLLTRVVELDAANALGWLWLASLAESGEQAIEYLRRVLAIEPQHEQALEFLRRVLLTQGIKVAKAGDKAEAQVYLLEASELDPGNEAVWLWLASTSGESAKTEAWLQKALAINPTNKRTVEWLERIRLADSLSKSTWRCPLCDAAGAEKSERCQHCRAVLTLTDLEAIIGNSEADRAALHQALERYRRQAEQQADFNANYYLGLAYLNLNQVAEAVKHLHRASRRRPEDEALKTQIGLLWRRENASQTNGVQPKERKPLVVPRTILIIDDSATVRKLVAVTLERRGHRVIAADGVMEALAKLNELTPDLVLLDITLPHTDGYQICNLIKSAANTKGVPVVILSGKDGFFDKVRGRTAGAVGYITKPFEPATLVRTVESYCNPSHRSEQQEER